MIGKQFLLTGIFWAFVGGLLSLFFRMQLAWPNETFPILESLLGSWAEGGKISNEFYYALIGARDMASPMMNMLSYWFFFAASVVLFVSFFIQTGPASGGWTAYPPLNGIRDVALNKGSGLGFDMWIVSHPEVYIIIFPTMGIVSEVLSVHSKKPVFGYKAMILSMGAILVIGYFVWAHHMFVTGMSPAIGKVFMIFTLLIAIPSAIKVFNWITTIWKGNLRFTPPMMFAIGFVSLFITGGITGIHLGNAVIDIQLHDSYFVVGHFHIVMGVAAFFGMWAGVYQWFPKMFGRFMNETLGYIHFWGSIIGGYMVFFPMHFMEGVPRRYYAFDQFQSFNNFQDI
eukprot:maker-scaffold4095_size6700-snap-gene-0.0 protein:Tk03123 transcript:maker-scaffold4095_size6700-snap-gene-0.0-mRNA-1 annotation:"cytochrome c oxidase"